MTAQPEAVRLADELDRVAKWSDSEHWDTLKEAATELRRLHELNQELLEALSWIDSRCPTILMNEPVHAIHREMSHDAGACARAALAKAR